MSEDRFAVLDLDEDFGEDYVAKKIAEPAQTATIYSQYVPGDAMYAASDLYGRMYASPSSQGMLTMTTLQDAAQLMNQYPNQSSNNQLAGLGNYRNPLYQGGLGSYGGGASGSTPNTYSEVVDRSVEADYEMDDYVVTEILGNGQRRRYRISRQEYADDRYGKYLR